LIHRCDRIRKGRFGPRFEATCQLISDATGGVFSASEADFSLRDAFSRSGVMPEIGAKRITELFRVEKVLNLRIREAAVSYAERHGWGGLTLVHTSVVGDRNEPHRRLLGALGLEVQRSGTSRGNCSILLSYELAAALTVAIGAIPIEMGV
jgi:hypothetical protein